MRKGKSRGRAFRHNIKRLTEKAQTRHREAYDRKQYDGHQQQDTPRDMTINSNRRQ